MVITNRTRVGRALLLSLLISTSATQLSAYNTWTQQVKETGATALVVGGVVAGVCAAYKGLEWLLTPSTQTLIQNARDSYATELQRHNEHACSLNSIYDQELHEQDLYRISMYFKQQPGRYYVNSLYDSIRRLSNHYSDLASRLQKLDMHEYSYAQPIITELMQKIDALVTDLNRVYRPLQKHISYFNLIECETILLNKYHAGLLLLAPHNPYINNALLNEHVHALSSNGYYGWHYPYMNYGRAIANDITQLQSFLYALTEYYPSRKRNAQELLDTLTILKSTVLSSIEYTQEYNRYELERMRLEQLRLTDLHLKHQQAQLAWQTYQIKKDCQQQYKEIAQACERDCKRTCEQLYATQEAINECKRACEKAARKAQYESDYCCETNCNW